MKSIEQKLKDDAKVFNQIPKDSVYNNIMQYVDDKTTGNKKAYTQSFKWLIPASFALTALIIFALNGHDLNVPTKTMIAIGLDQHNQQLASQEVNLDLMALSFENNLTQSIKNEQQAIVSDINFIKGLLIL